jgi:16S rRNA C1402 N4-methylase RsmH
LADAIGHTPVLLAEVLELLAPKPGATIVDCTVGRGGHSAAILERISPGGTLIGLDADPRNLEFAAARLRGINPDPDRVRLFHANFSELEDVLSAAGVTEVDGILADLGLKLRPVIRGGRAPGHADRPACPQDGGGPGEPPGRAGVGGSDLSPV